MIKILEKTVGCFYVTEAIFDGGESGQVDIFPDAIAEEYTGPCAVGAKTFENDTAQMLAPAGSQGSITSKRSGLTGVF